MTAKIKLNAASGGGSVSLQAPSTTTSNAAVELQLPVADGSANQFIKTDGSGNLSFAEAGGGKILQVVSTEKSDAFSTTSTSFTDVTGMSASLTPSSTNSKILLIGNFSHSSTAASLIKMFRDIGGGGYSGIAVGDTSGNRTTTFAGSAPYLSIGGETMLSQNAVFLDSPNTTSAVTYKLQARAISGTIYINRPTSTANTAGQARSRSSITLLEVGA